MDTATEAALAFGVVAIGGTLLYYNSMSKSDPDAEKKQKDADWKKKNPWDCSDQQAGSESPLGKIINQAGDWTGAQSCTGNPTGNQGPTKRMVKIFTGYGSAGPATCDPNDEDCDDERERDCDVVHTMNIYLTEADIAAKRAGHLLIESDADIEFLKNRCKAEQAAHQHQVQASRDEDTRFANLRTRLFNQFADDVKAGRDVAKIYSPTSLKMQCSTAQLGAQYCQKLLDEFATSVAAAVNNQKTHVIPFPVSYGYKRGVDPASYTQTMIINWKGYIDKARPDGPWPKLPTYDELMKDTAGFTPAQAHSIVDTVSQYLVDAQLHSSYWTKK